MYHDTTRAHRVLMAVLAEIDRQDMSLERLAELWGVEPEWAAGRLSGKKGLTGSELAHIARALGVPVEQFTDGHSVTGICTLAPDRPRADVGLCRVCLEQGLFDALVRA